MTLQEASLNLTEEAYRELPLLSYSALSRYDREGYECVGSLFEPISSPSLTFGSLVDCLLTQGERAFTEKYTMIVDSYLPPASIKVILDELSAKNPHKWFVEIPDEQIAEVANANNYQKGWKDTTKVAKIRELGTSYFDFIRSADGKIVVSEEDVTAARKAQEVLLTNPITAMYFNDNPFANIEKFYQLQFKANDWVSGRDYKVMLDLVLINHDDKTIIPCDLKTTKSIYSFEESFYKYRYYIQASMYSCALGDTIAKNCPELSTYKIQPYRFIVIDRNVFQPVVFEWEPIEYVTDLYWQPRRNWRDLLSELSWALENADKKLPRGWYDELTSTSVVKLLNYNIEK